MAASRAGAALAQRALAVAPLALRRGLMPPALEVIPWATVGAPVRLGVAASPHLLHGVPVLHTWLCRRYMSLRHPRRRFMGSWCNVRRLHYMCCVLVGLLLVLLVLRMYMVVYMVVSVVVEVVREG